MIPFTLAGYAELLKALRGAGYQDAHFLGEREGTGKVWLRHDVDQDPLAALQVARHEHALGFRANYFFLLRTANYSLLEPETLALVREVAALGHWVGLHCDEPRMQAARADEPEDFDARVERELDLFQAVVGPVADRMVSFHNPSRQLVGHSPAGYVNAYDAAFMLPQTKYISDSNQHWREGDPLAAIQAAAQPRWQILTHPIWWASETPREPLSALGEAFERRLARVDAYFHDSALWQAAGGRGVRP